MVRGFPGVKGPGRGGISSSSLSSGKGPRQRRSLASTGRTEGPGFAPSGSKEASVDVPGFQYAAFTIQGKIGS